MKRPIRTIHIDKISITALKFVLAFNLALITITAITFIHTRSPWSLLLLIPTIFPSFKVTKEEPRQ